MTDRLRSPLFNGAGDPDVRIARIRCLAIARSLKAGIELLEELAPHLPNEFHRERAAAWTAFQRDRFDIPRS